VFLEVTKQKERKKHAYDCRVKWFNDSKGFGFITPEDGQKDCFVHHSAIQDRASRALPKAIVSSSTIVAGNKGPAAANVTKI